MMGVMSSATGFIAHHFVLVLIVLCALAIYVIWLIRRPVSADKAANWPVTEGTIQLVNRAIPARTSQNPDSVYIGDFSYYVNNDYYSGRVMITRSFSTHDSSPKDLINQKIQVRYNPRKPEKFSVPQAELGGFLLDPYDETFGDNASIDINIDQI
jgi:Protein of unknown function (DUF3592)